MVEAMTAGKELDTDFDRLLKWRMDEIQRSVILTSAQKTARINLTNRANQRKEDRGIRCSPRQLSSKHKHT